MSRVGLGQKSKPSFFIYYGLTAEQANYSIIRVYLTFDSCSCGKGSNFHLGYSFNSFDLLKHLSANDIFESNIF